MRQALFCGVVLLVLGSACAQQTALEIADDGAAIKMGSSFDAVLYRSSANVLRATGNLQVGTTLSVEGNTALRASLTTQAGAGISVTGDFTGTGTVTMTGSTSAKILWAQQKFTAGITGQPATTTTIGTPILIGTAIGANASFVNHTGRFLHKVSSCKLLFSPSPDANVQFASAIDINSDLAFNAIPMTNKINSRRDAWDTENPTGGSALTHAMWKGTNNVYVEGFDTPTPVPPTAPLVPQNAICSPFAVGDVRGYGLYLVTGHANFGGCDRKAGIDDKTVRIMSLVAKYSGDTNKYILASRSVAATSGPTSLSVSEIVFLEAAACVYLTIRHNCDGPLSLVTPIGLNYNNGAWSTITGVPKASLSMTYLGSKNPTPPPP